MRHTIDFAEAEPSALDGFAVALLRQVNMTLIQAQSSAVMETLRQYEAQGVKALAAGGAPPWWGKEPWVVYYSLGSSGLTLNLLWFDEASVLGWCPFVREVLQGFWVHARRLLQAGKTPAEAYAAQMEDMQRSVVRLPWARLSDVLSEEAERIFRQRLRDAVMDSLLSARPKPGAPRELQEGFLVGLLADLDAVEEISPVGGVIYQRYLWTAAGLTTDDFAEAVEAELRVHEPQGTLSGRDQMRDCMRILLASGVDLGRVRLDKRAACVSYRWSLA